MSERDLLHGVPHDIVVVELSQAQSQAFVDAWRRRLMEASRKVGAAAKRAAAALKEDSEC